MSEASRLSRRWLLGVGGAGAAALLGGGSRPSTAAETSAGDALVSADGSYPMLPLRRDVIAASAVQSRMLAVDPASPKKGLAANLAHMLDQIDAVQSYFGAKDLLSFHEFILQGWDRWDRRQIERLAIDVPGEQTEAIGKKAREHKCYITFGGYARLADWPGHLIDLMVIVGPTGEVIGKHWKARNLRSDREGADYFTTTVYDVYDQYVEKYGIDETIPVTRTDIGNITVSSVLREPELFRVMAMKGAEIFVRSGLGGYSWEDGSAVSRYNRAFTLFMSNALSPGNKGFFEDNNMLGRTTIFDTRGEALGEAGKHETAVNGLLRMGERRASPRMPDVYWPLYKPFYDQYQSRFTPNAYASYRASDLADASRHIRTTRRWKM
jgi:predicted amidohydrolase